MTGHTVIDALHTTARKQVPFSDPVLQELADTGRRILLVATHRRETKAMPCAASGVPLPGLPGQSPSLQWCFQRIGTQ